MNQKQKLIKKMIAMQKKFIRKQRESGVTSKEYFAPDANDELHGYGDEFDKMAREVVDLAHDEQGSSR